MRIEPNPSQNAYLSLLTSKITKEQTETLPTQYQNFAEAFIEGDKTQINKSLADIKPLTSRLISSALARESIDDINIQELIDGLSYHGYKRALLAWLSQQMQREDDPKEKARLKAKIHILTSN